MAGRCPTAQGQAVARRHFVASKPSLSAPFVRHPHQGQARHRRELVVELRDDQLAHGLQTP